MKARMKLDNKIQKKIKEEVRAEYERKGQDLARRHVKLICVALNEHFGFGKDRLMKLINAYGELCEERKDDEIFWYHIDKYLERIGLDFQKEDYEVMDI